MKQVEQKARQAGKTEEKKRQLDPRQCRACEQTNTLDQWYELPNTPYLVCSTCASTHTYARPIHINTLVERLLEAYTVLQSLKSQNDELRDLVEGVPGLEKQLRRLVKAVERQARATEQIDQGVTELVENLSPRWLFPLESEHREATKKLMTRLSQEAGPGAILEVTQEEYKLAQKMVRL